MPPFFRKSQKGYSGAATHCPLLLTFLDERSSLGEIVLYLPQTRRWDNTIGSRFWPNYSFSGFLLQQQAKKAFYFVLDISSAEFSQCFMHCSSLPFMFFDCPCMSWRLIFLATKMSFEGILTACAPVGHFLSNWTHIFLMFIVY